MTDRATGEFFARLQPWLGEGTRVTHRSPAAGAAAETHLLTAFETAADGAITLCGYPDEATMREGGVEFAERQGIDPRTITHIDGIRVADIEARGTRIVSPNELLEISRRASRDSRRDQLGTAQDAIDFHLSGGADEPRSDFLSAWQRGDVSDWLEYQPRPARLAKPEDAEVRGLVERLGALASDCDNTDGWEAAAADVRQAANRITGLAGSASGWLPQIGERVEVVEDYPDSGSWLRTPLWVAGIRVAESGDGLDITVTEQWPVPYRHASNYLGHTDGFFVGRRNKRNDLRPATAHMKDEA